MAEVPAIFLQMIAEYQKMDKPDSFWKTCPPELLHIKEDNAELQNKLVMFLNEGQFSNPRKWVERVEGKHVLLEEFKSAYFSYAKFKHGINAKWDSKLEPVILSNHGFEQVTYNLCKSCGKKAAKGCCRNYHPTNRQKKQVINSMVIHSSDGPYGFRADYDDDL